MIKFSWRIAGLASLAGGTAIALTSWGCGSASDDAELHLATSRGALQWNYLGTTETDTRYGVNLITTSSTGTRKGRSTGALRHTDKSGPLIGDDGNCGVTFISHHYAVTASHCVSSDDGFTINGGGFTVQQIDTTTLDVNALGRSSVVTDLYNQGNLADWYRAAPLTASNGYVVASYNCTLIQRCMAAYNGGPVTACPNMNDVDQALIRCGTSLDRGRQRPSTGLNWVQVSPSDPGNLNVEAWWFHEVVDLSTDPYDTPYTPPNNAAHYFFLSTVIPNQLNNYHYYQTQSLPGNVPEMLPLRSKTAVGGTPYTALSHSTHVRYMDTNVPGCHGTSGSGMFDANSDDLLGNVVHGTDAWVNSNECDPLFSSGAQTTFQMDYVMAVETAHLQNQSIVTNDRQP